MAATTDDVGAAASGLVPREDDVTDTCPATPLPPCPEGASVSLGRVSPLRFRLRVCFQETNLHLLKSTCYQESITQYANEANEANEAQ